MVATKDAHEYIHVRDFSLVQNHLKTTSDRLQQGIDNTFNAKDLHEQRIAEFENARELLSEILKDSEEVEKYLLKESFKKELAEKRARVVQKPGAKRVARPKADSGKDYVEKSQKALENLQKNIQELKQQLEI